MAKEKVAALSSYIANEKRAGREMNNAKGALIRIIERDTGGIKLGSSRPNEREKRMAEKEKKYRDIYIT